MKSRKVQHTSCQSIALIRWLPSEEDERVALEGSRIDPFHFGKRSFLPSFPHSLLILHEATTRRPNLCVGRRWRRAPINKAAAASLPPSFLCKAAFIRPACLPACLPACMSGFQRTLTLLRSRLMNRLELESRRSAFLACLLPSFLPSCL